jgi:hypothetical protein
MNAHKIETCSLFLEKLLPGLKIRILFLDVPHSDRNGENVTQRITVVF